MPTPITFKTILCHDGLDPALVPLVRNQDTRRPGRTTPDELWRASDGRSDWNPRSQWLELVHPDGVLTEKPTYEIMRPEDVGWGQSRMVLGKVSGRHALAVRLRAIGVDLAGAELDKAFRRFKTLADGKKEVEDGDLLDVAKGLGHTVGHG